MPEGDTVHRVATQLAQLVGERVEAVAPHPRGAATGVAQAIDGRRLERVEARGKHLLLHFDSGITVHNHLRLTGRWRVEPVGTVRRGRPWLVLRAGQWEAVQWNGPILELGTGAVARLGPDVLSDSIDGRMLARAVLQSDPARPLADALLDQGVIAGIGTLWLAELLWHARLWPWRPVRDVDEDVLTDAIEWTRSRMRASVGAPRPLRSVHRRAGRPCPRCGAPITTGPVGEHRRTVHYCPRCQTAAALPS